MKPSNNIVIVNGESEAEITERRRPEFVLRKLWVKIPVYIKFTFAAAFVLFLLIHMFMLTNKLPNHDEIFSNFRLVQGHTSGRWFSHVPMIPRSTFSMPWLIGVLSATYLAASSSLIVACFRIKKKLHCLLTAAIVVSFPSITGKLSYMTIVDAALFGMLMVCVGAYLANRFKFGFILSIALFTLSLGIYQIYFPLGAAILVGILILDILELKSFKSTVIKSIKFLAVLGISLMLYLIITPFTVEALSGYMGIDQMGQIPISAFPGLIRNAYLHAFAFMFANARFVHNNVTTLAFFFIAAATLLVLLLNMPRVFKHDKKQFVFLILLLIALPLAANLIEVMGATSVHLLMIYGLIIIPLFVIAIVGNHSSFHLSSLAKPFRKCANWGMLAANWIVVIGLFLACFNYTVIANQAYLRLHMVYEQGFAFSNRLMMRIESLDGFTGEEEIIFAGSPSAVQPFNEMLRVPELSHLTGIISFIPSIYSYSIFLQHYMAVNQTIVSHDDYITRQSHWDWLEEKGFLSDVIEMPAYPADGSIVRIDDHTILVRFLEGTP